MKILCHLSGGYDSVAAIIKLLDEGHEVAGVFFDLGQIYVKQERAAAQYVADYCNVTYGDKFLGFYDEKVPMYQHRAADGSPSEYIPVRNMVFAAHSANMALSMGFEGVAHGSKTTQVRPDDPYSFSDCSVSFYQQVTQLVDFCSEGGDSVKFFGPLITYDGYDWVPMTKGAVVQIILDSGVDMNKLWTCYKDGEKACGECYHCVDAKKAFAEINYDGAILFLKQTLSK